MKNVNMVFVGIGLVIMLVAALIKEFQIISDSATSAIVVMLLAVVGYIVTTFCGLRVHHLPREIREIREEDAKSEDEHK